MSERKVVSARVLLADLEANEYSPSNSLAATPQRYDSEARIATTSQPSVKDWLKSLSSSPSTEYRTPTTLDFDFCRAPQALRTNHSHLHEAEKSGSHRLATTKSPSSSPENEEPRTADDSSHEEREAGALEEEDDINCTVGETWPQLTRTPFISKEQALMLDSDPPVVLPAHIGTQSMRINDNPIAESREPRAQR